MISHTLNSKFIHGLLAFAILFWIFVDVKAQHGCARDITVYIREILLDLRPGDLGPKPSGYEHFPRDIKPRKRGKRGGVRNRIMNRKSKPALPTILFGNVRSLPNKMDEVVLVFVTCLNTESRALCVFQRPGCMTTFPITNLD